MIPSVRSVARAFFLRTGNLLERRKDWRRAEKLYSAGIALNRRGAAALYGRRAAIRARQGRWAESISDYTAVPGVTPPPKVALQLASELRRDGQATQAVSMLAAAVARKSSAQLWSALAESYADMADVDGAVGAYAQAVALKPGNLTTRTSLGVMQTRRSLVPFTLIDNLPVRADDDVRKKALVDSVYQLEHVVTESSARTWAAFWLGRAYEMHDRLQDSRAAYQIAVERVRQVDKPWAHNAELAWRFRLAYIEARLTGEPSSDQRINRSLQPGEPTRRMSEVAGYFDASITNNGLHVDGFVLHDHTGSIEVYLDDTRVMSVSGDTSSWSRPFKATIVHDVVSTFPRTSKFTIRTGNAPLVTLRGAEEVTVDVPDGAGTLFGLLTDGRSITKKGRWATTLPPEQANELYLAAYDEAREFFDSSLGIKLFASYGTLLGCYRDGRLIPGDDDFDVSFVTSATSPEELKAEVSEVIRALLRAGFDTRVAVDGRMFHLRVGSLVLDVNPVWFYDGRAWAFDAHALGREVFDSVDSLTVAGVEVFIPGKAAEFLQENYGPDWRTPRSDFVYHRARADRAILRKAFLLPSEVRDLQDYSEKLRADDPSAGTFHGYGNQADPRFL